MMSILKTDFGYNRLNIRYKQCVWCITTQAKYKEKDREELREKEQIRKYDSYDPNRNNKQCDKIGETKLLMTSFYVICAVRQ